MQLRRVAFQGIEMQLRRVAFQIFPYFLFPAPLLVFINEKSPCGIRRGF